MIEKKDNTALPPFFINSIPKSGTHLLIQIAKGIPGVSYFQDIYEGKDHQVESHRTLLKSLQHNQFVGGHIYHSPKWRKMFQQVGMKQVFLSRDPRDIVVSYAYYIDKIPEDPLYKYSKENNLTQKQKYLALIEGFNSPGALKPNIKQYLLKFMEWRNCPNVLPITYEELVFSPLIQKITIEKIANFLFGAQLTNKQLDEVVSSMINNINREQSATFRKGKIGSWRDEFDEEVKDRFKEIAGDILIDLFYEKDLNW